MEPTTDSYIAIMSKAAPSITVTGITLAGFGLQDWVFILTIVYTLMTIGQMAYKWLMGLINGR